MGAFRFSLAGGTITQARIAFGGMAGTPKRALLSEAALAGVSLADPAGWDAALDALAEDYQPLTDQRATSAYRSMVARNLLLKALTEVAGADTEVTRLIAHRGGLEAAQ
jgi:xanthine dehydrogenase small subunit